MAVANTQVRPIRNINNYANCNFLRANRLAIVEQSKIRVQTRQRKVLDMTTLSTH
jgi:hypothetical protein